MTKELFEKGDWVYWRREDGRAEEVFKYVATKYNRAYDTPSSYFENCHRLNPLKQVDDVKVGDRVAVIHRIDNNPNAINSLPVGTVDIVTDASKCNLVYVRGDYFAYEPIELARLPDCAQDQNHNQLRSVHGGVPDEYHKLPSDDYAALMNLEPIDELETFLDKSLGEPIPMIEKRRVYAGEVISSDKAIPCPHPAWEGIWIASGPLRVSWDGYRWLITQYDNQLYYDKTWTGPKVNGWRFLEPAPKASVSGPKLSRPQKHGGIKTPIDTGW